MDFLLWVCRTMHAFSVIIWLGGLMFQGAVMTPIVQSEGSEARSVARLVNKRFTGFVWMSAWTLAATGTLMMLLSPKFLWFHFNTKWQIFLGIKQIIFLLMIFYAFGYARMVEYLDKPTMNGGYDNKADLYRHRVTQYRIISIFLGITALMLSAGMMYVG